VSKVTLDMGRISVLAALVFFVGAIWFAIKESREWDVYAAEHHCREVSRVWRGVLPQLMPSPAGNGQMTLQMVDQGDEVTYHCDNGVIKR
jgi:hypothetical protein